MIDNTLCACGCGGVINSIDSKGRSRKFISGHSARITKYNLIKNYIPPEKKNCTICGDERAIEFFYYKTYTSKTTGEKYRRYRAECITCSKNQGSVYRNDKAALISAKKKARREKYKNDIKYHVQEKIATWRKASCVPSDLTVDYLVNLYNQQGGCCYYTGEKMIFGWADGKVRPQTMSLDKLDPDKGYIKGNVVWCCYLANTMKQNMDEKTFYSVLQNILKRRRDEVAQM
jgi:hypothetical protein